MKVLSSLLFGVILSSGMATSRAADMAASSRAVEKLKENLAKAGGGFADVVKDGIEWTPLTREDSEKAAKIVWEDHARWVKAEREAELKSGKLELSGKVMPFSYKKFGKAPEQGHSLWISMHGGGGAPARVNDRQWENQKRLYTLEEGIYLVPRAPTDTWDLWHQGHIDAMFTRLIEDMIIVEGVDPNRVYIMGYSAGGDGVFQLAPRMADQLAAAAMMAGHPNETQPLGLRNLPFALQMGGNDAAYNRNKIAREWAGQLDALERRDRGGYVHFVKIYEGKGHWMDGEDKVALPWMAKFSRNVHPDRVAWRQDDVIHPRFYWLAVEPSKARAGQELVVSRTGQDFVVERAAGVDEFELVLDDNLVDLDRPVRVFRGHRLMQETKAERTLENISKAFQERPEPCSMAPARISVKLNP